MIPNVSALGRKNVVVLSENEIDSLVRSILSSLTKDAKCFERSTNLYNSTFFKTESFETTTRLCSALADFFAPEFSNSYWNTHRSL